MESKNKPIVWGIIILLIGIIITIISLVIDSTPDQLTHILHVVIKLLEHLGIALIVIGFAGIILDFRDWKNYFQERLADIIVDKNYLVTLDKTELIALQVATLKAFFATDDIDREGSFLNYFQSKIHNLIGSPYRESVNMTIIVEEIDESTFKITEQITYVCRKVGDQIQDAIVWGLDEIEDTSITDVKFKIKCPDDYISQCASKCDQHDTCGSLIQLPSEAVNDHIFKVDLELYKNIDRLQVAVEAAYTTAKMSFYTIGMAHPTKGFSLTVIFPETLRIRLDTYGLQQNYIYKRENKGTLTLGYNSWILPDNGVAYGFETKKKNVGGSL